MGLSAPDMVLFFDIRVEHPCDKAGTDGCEIKSDRGQAN